jgi:hypothetical protein
MKLHVKYEENVVKSHRQPVEFGDWSQTCDFQVTGAYLNAEPRYTIDEFEVNFEAKAGETLYVLYVNYSTGDSFGTARGKGSLLHVFLDPAVAYAAKKAVQEQEPEKPSHFEFIDEAGKTIKVSNPASSYFENISGIHIQDVQLHFEYI